MWNKVLLIGLFFLLSFHHSKGQAFILGEDTTVVFSAGIEQNYFLSLHGHPFNNILVKANHSILVDNLKFQLFSLQLYYSKQIFNDIFRPGISGRIFGQYSAGITEMYITPEFKLNLLKRLSLLAECNITYDKNKVLFFEKVGLKLCVNKEISTVINYGTPYWNYTSEKVFNFSLIFTNGNLIVKPEFEIPENFEIRYSRLMLSFSYAFKKSEKI